MKILLVNDNQQRVGGTEVYVESLAEHLSTQGHEVRFYYGSSSYSDSVRRRTFLSSYLNRIFSFKHLASFKKVVKDFHPDVIHLHNIFNEISPSILLGTGSVPVVMTLHDNCIVQAVFDQMMRSGPRCKNEVCPGCANCVGVKGMIYEKIKRFVHHFLLQNIKAFIAPSKYLQNIVASNSSHRPEQIYNGFALPKPLPFISNFTAIFIGRLTDDKGVDTLIDAVPKILYQIPDFKLLVAGKGVSAEELKDQVKKLKIQDSVSFLGSLSKADVFENLKSSSLVVVPSNWPENLPTVCVEALSSGKPIVATQVGGIPEIVEHNENGILVAPHNPDLLSKAITDLLTDTIKLKKFSDHGARSVKKFEIEQHLVNITRIYTRVIHT